MLCPNLGCHDLSCAALELDVTVTTLQAVSRFISELSEKIVQGKGHNPFKMMLAGVQTIVL